MLKVTMLIVATLLIIIAAFVLMIPEVRQVFIRPTPCPVANGVKEQIAVLKEMNDRASPPSSQPVYTLFRNVPKDVLTDDERRHCREAVSWFSNEKLVLLDVENVDWMAADESSPIVALMDARVKVADNHDVIRIIMMWCQRNLWSVKLANAEGCFRSLDQKECVAEVGVVSNKAVLMPEQKVLKSIMGRKQSFKWDNTGVLDTESESDSSPMINSAWTERPAEIFQNPTLPNQSGKDIQNQAMFFKTFGVPRS